ncbi:MAG: histidinol-phosphatase [Desulfobulbaceae bacterium]|nr:histidinol-phosphatase [Desulfobulbaceae bacterium]
MLDLTIDGHIHTNLCRHAVGEMEDYVRVGLGRGLRQLFFLEHLERGINYFERTWLTDADFDEYFRRGRELKEKYRGRLQVGLGVEVGYNPQCRDELLSALAAREWERIGISYHFLAVSGRHFNLVSRRSENLVVLGELGVEKVLSDYFATLLEAVEIIPGQVVCHLDAVMRHHPEVRLAAGHYRQIEEILAAMSRRGMALEINASGLPRRGQPYPNQEIIAEAVRRGITLTAGSDSHRPEDVGGFAALAAFMSAQGVPVVSAI